MPVPAGGGASSDMLVTVAELAAYLQTDLTATTATATLAIQLATGVIQAITGQTLLLVVDDTVTIGLDEIETSRYLVLPQLPVTAVGSVLIGSTAVTDHTVDLFRGRLYRSTGWRLPDAFPWSAPSTVTVTYTHGWAAGDRALQLARSVCLVLAAEAYGNPSGAQREQIDDYAVQYADMSSRLDVAAPVRAALRQRYARGRHSAQLVRV